MALASGTILGPYEILAPLVVGGMGEVWKARDTRLDRSVAIKTINGAFSERFEREAHAISSLNHPHICALYSDFALSRDATRLAFSRQDAGNVDVWTLDLAHAAKPSRFWRRTLRYNRSRS